MPAPPNLGLALSATTALNLPWAAAASRCLSCLPLLRQPHWAQQLGARRTVAQATPQALAPPPTTPEPKATAMQARPRYHLQPLKQGWINDPNGIHYDPSTKLYHMFWQHYGTGSVWSWGLSWGHACTRDLIRWHYLPPALQPTPNTHDADGVWSGCAFPTDSGTVILNTAVRLRSNTPSSLLPPSALDIGQQMIETQAFAVADNQEDPLLRSWTKGSAPLLSLPPLPGLTGWRDPFLIGRPGDGVHDKWTMIVGSGYAPPVHAGAALVYTSDQPTSGWEFRGDLCRGDGTSGSVWECPLLVQLPVRDVDMPSPVAGTGNGVSAGHQHLLVVCPDNAHHAPLYQLGAYDPHSLTFDTTSATRLAPVDLGGPTFYAPNILTNDPLGRIMMWGWCQELGRPEGEYNSACCLSVPRMMWRHPEHPDRLWQEPLSDLQGLREEGTGWAADAPLTLAPAIPFNLPLPPSQAGHDQHLELQVTFARPSPGSRVAKSAVLLPATTTDDIPVPLGEASGRHGAALVYDWNAGSLHMVYSDGTLPLPSLAALPSNRYAAMNARSTVSVSGGNDNAGEPDLLLDDEWGLLEAAGLESHEMGMARAAFNVAGCHSVGGPLHRAEGSDGLNELTLRVFVDGSLMEVFTSTGQVLTTRVYRHVASQTACLPIQLASYGAPCLVTQCEVHAMACHWEPESALSTLEAQARATSAVRDGPGALASPTSCARELAMPRVTVGLDVPELLLDAAADLGFLGGQAAEPSPRAVSVA